MSLVFMFNQLIKAVVMYGVQYSTGLLVKHKGMKVNYTRKINHFVLFFVPAFVDRGFAMEESLELFALGGIGAVVSLVIYIGPIRQRVPFIDTMFKSFDRPEDRPHTLLWLSTQVAAGQVVIISMTSLFVYYDLTHLILIPILINGIGDGLAEPVGVRFGKHPYETRALFTQKRYVRTYEGSACVFFTSLIVVCLFHTLFTPWQLVAALVILPPLMTLTEAVSPHTWDNPFLFLVGYLALWGISFI